jgi:putative DNA primase/helicase
MAGSLKPERSAVCGWFPSRRSKRSAPTRNDRNGAGQGGVVNAAETIASALGGAYPSGGWWRCRCPVHQSNGSTLALRNAPQGLVAYCHAGCSRDAVLAELDRRGLLDDSAGVAVPDPIDVVRDRQAAEHNRQKRIAEALDFWKHETVDPRGTAVERYWIARGLALPIPPTIRASRRLLRHPEGGARPAMIALVQHAERGPVAIHRTWLAVDGSGKASFREPRRSLGPVGGAAMRLAPIGETLVVAEGIETTASVMLATGSPAWAAISAIGIERLILPPPPHAATVIIAADNDANRRGESAARIAAQRWLAEGRRVRLAMPPEPGTDFNDVLLGRAEVLTKGVSHVTAA